MHCPKAFMRAHLWEPETWPERSSLPTMGEILKAHCGDDGPAESPEAQEARSRAQLY